MFYLAVGCSLLFALLTVVIISRSYAKGVREAQEAIADSIIDAVAGIDSKRNIAFVNPAFEKISGVPKEKAIGQPIDAIIKLYDGQLLIAFAQYGDGIKTGLKLRTESTEIPLMVIKSPLKLGNQHGSLLTLHNESQEHQLEEMKVDFVSMAAHELRTPLTAIRGYASLLQMHYAAKLEDSAKELLIRLIVSTTNLANLIDNLLSVSRIERNSLIIESKPVDLGVIARDVFESFQEQATTRKQQYVLQVPEHLPLVMADPFRIGQVFINLISNAVNYTKEGGAVSVTISDKNGMIEVSVKDNGEGIPPEALPRLFTKFFRVSGSLEQGSKGTGLGLYITKSIVEMHKGKIWAESVLGQGSTFTFAIPTATKENIEASKQVGGKDSLTVKNGQGIIVKKQS